MTEKHDNDGEAELEIVRGDVADTEIRSAAAGPKPRALVVVDNLDDGETVRFWVRYNAKIRRVIREVYKQFELDREDGDRLICVEDQENVLALEAESVAEYVERHDGQPRIHWQYSGPTGGAQR